MATKRRINSVRMARRLMTERGDGDAGAGADDDVPGTAEITFGKDGGRGAGEPDEDIGVAPADPDRERQEHRRKGKVETEALGIADRAADQMPDDARGEPGAVEHKACSHEEA